MPLKLAAADRSVSGDVQAAGCEFTSAWPDMFIACCAVSLTWRMLTCSNPPSSSWTAFFDSARGE